VINVSMKTDLGEGPEVKAVPKDIMINVE